jgi:hypothetical protein
VGDVGLVGRREGCPSPKPHPTRLTTDLALATGQGTPESLQDRKQAVHRSGRGAHHGKRWSGEWDGERPARWSSVANWWGLAQAARRT